MSDGDADAYTNTSCPSSTQCGAHVDLTVATSKDRLRPCGAEGGTSAGVQEGPDHDEDGFTPRGDQEATGKLTG